MTVNAAREARKQDRLLGRIQRSAIITAKKDLRQFAIRAKSAALKGDADQLGNLLTSRLIKSVDKVAQESYLSGIRAVEDRLKADTGKTFKDLAQDEKEAGEITLALSQASIIALRKYLNINFKRVKQSLRTQGILSLRETSEGVESAIRTTIGEIAAEGLHVKDAKIRIKETLVKQGVDPEQQKPYAVERTVRTQSSIFYNTAQYQALQAPLVRQMLWGYTYSAVRGNRTRESHYAQNGVVLPKDHPWWQTWWTPNGYNCRCAIIPLFIEEPLVYPDYGYDPDPGFETNFGAMIV